MRRVVVMGAVLAGAFVLPTVPALVLPGCGGSVLTPGDSAAEGCSMEATFPLESGEFSICAGGTHTFENSGPGLMFTLTSDNVDALEVTGTQTERSGDELSARLCNANFGDVVVQSAAEVDYALLVEDAGCADE